MELINWSLSALDKIFPKTRNIPGNPLCPDGTYVSGYVRDAWDTWRPLCLEALDLEDVEDLFIFWTLVLGILLIGASIFMSYLKIRKTMANQTMANQTMAGKLVAPLSMEIKRTQEGISTLMSVLHQKFARIDGLVCEIQARSEENRRKIDNIVGQTGQLQSAVTGLTVKLEEISKMLHALTKDE